MPEPLSVSPEICSGNWPLGGLKSAKNPTVSALVVDVVAGSVVVVVDGGGGLLCWTGGSVVEVVVVVVVGAAVVVVVGCALVVVVVALVVVVVGGVVVVVVVGAVVVVVVGGGGGVVVVVEVVVFPLHQSFHQPQRCQNEMVDPAEAGGGAQARSPNARTAIAALARYRAILRRPCSSSEAE